MGNLELDDKIDRFLLNQMSKEEKEEFLELVSSNESIKRDIEQRKLTFASLREVNNDRLKNQLVTHEKNNYPQYNLKIVYAIAASVLLLIASSIVWFTSIANDNLKQFDFYEDAIPNYMNNISKNMSFHEAMNEFKLGNYKKAAQGFQVLSDNGLDSDTIHYFLGVSLYRNSEFIFANRYFEMIDSSSVYFYKAKFRELIIEYQFGNKLIAIEGIRKIATDPEHPYNEKAASFLKEEKVSKQ